MIDIDCSIFVSLFLCVSLVPLRFHSSSRSLFICTGIVIAFDTMAYFGFRFAHPQKMPDRSKSMPTIQWMRWWDPKTHTNNLLNAPKIIWTLLMREIKDVRAHTVIVLSTNPTHTHTHTSKKWATEHTSAMGLMERWNRTNGWIVSLVTWIVN